MNILDIYNKFTRIIEDNETLLDVANISLEHEGYSKGWYAQKWNSEYLLKTFKNFYKEFEDYIGKLKAEALKRKVEQDKQNKQNEKHLNYEKPTMETHYRFNLIGDGKGTYLSCYWNPKKKELLDVVNSHYDISVFLQKEALKKGLSRNYDDFHWCGFYSYYSGNNVQVLTFYDESCDYKHTEEGWELLRSYVKECILEKKEIHATHVILMHNDGQCEVFENKFNINC